MTVKELIAQLQWFPPNTPVIVNHHNSYDISVGVDRMFDAGGGWSPALRDVDRAKLVDVVVIDWKG